MGNEIARRDPRYDIAIPVTIRSLLGDRDVVTDDVSYRGLFLRTELPLTKMQLLRVSIALPTQAEPIVTSVVVANLGTRTSPGVGASFYGFQGQQRSEWEKFVHFARDQSVAGARSLVDAAATPSNRAAPEELVVAVASGRALERLSYEIAQGSLLVHSRSALDADAPVSVRLVHPVTHGDFQLTGVVRGRTSGGQVTVSLPSMDSGTHSRLADFVDSGVDFASLRPSKKGTHAA